MILFPFNSYFSHHIINIHHSSPTYQPLHNHIVIIIIKHLNSTYATNNVNEDDGIKENTYKKIFGYRLMYNDYTFDLIQCLSFLLLLSFHYNEKSIYSLRICKYNTFSYKHKKKRKEE